MAFSSLLRLTSELDDRLRFVDFGTQRTVGGLCDRVFKIRRHTLAALILPFLLIFFLFLASPSLQRMLWALPVAIIFGAVICRLMQATDRKERPVRVDLVLQVA